MRWIQDSRPATSGSAPAAALARPSHVELAPPGRAQPCRQQGCRVGEGGRADCGALACPACGSSGWNLVCPDGFDGDWLVRCVCGFSWVRSEAA